MTELTPAITTYAKALLRSLQALTIPTGHPALDEIVALIARLNAAQFDELAAVLAQAMVTESVERPRDY